MEVLQQIIFATLIFINIAIASLIILSVIILFIINQFGSRGAFLRKHKAIINSIASYYIDQYINRCSLMIAVAIYITIFYYFPVLYIPPESTVKHIFEVLGYIKPNDEIVNNLLDGIIKVIISVLPLSLPFYYFIYREQKLTAESAINKNNLSLSILGFFYTSVFTLIYCAHLKSIFSNAMVSPCENLAITMDNLYRVIFCIVVVFFTIFIGLKVANTLLVSINMRWMLKKIIDEIKDGFEKLIYGADSPWFKKIRAYIYKTLNYLIESVYQTLIQAINKDVTEVYHTNFNAWNEVLYDIYNDKHRRYIYLLDKDGDLYRKLYESILKNHLSLIIALYGKNKMHDGSECVSNFFDLAPNADLGNDELKKEYNTLIISYFAILYELAIFLHKNDHIGLYPIIKNIENMPVQRIGVDNIITLFRALIIKSIEKNDVRLLSSLTYSLIKIVELKKSCQPQGKGLLNIILSRINNQLKGDEQSVGICIYILLQAALKGVEISHYSCTGFIIKYIVSNFESEVLNKVYRKFSNNDNGTKDSIIESARLCQELGNSFHINKTTAKYCLEKLFLLLYGQQKYIKEKGIGINCIPKGLIKIPHITIGNLDYLFNKLDGAKEKYSLVYLKDEEFMLGLKNDLGISKINKVTRRLFVLGRNVGRNNQYKTVEKIKRIKRKKVVND